MDANEAETGTDAPTPVSARRGFALAASLLRQAGHAVIDLAFPPSCLACRRAVSDHGGLCAACWNSVRFIERPFCERLGTPFQVDLGADGLVSPDAIANPPVFSRARAVVRFEDGPSRRLVHRLKYGDRLELAAIMGRWMARAGEDVLTEADLLVPVPLHRSRLIWRRFNQSAALARAISEGCGVPVGLEALTRRKRTAPQVGLSRNQRAVNVQGAFHVASDRTQSVDGRAVVLVDDVLTSGATLNAAARALLRGGARRVDVLVFARVVAGT